MSKATFIAAMKKNTYLSGLTPSATRTFFTNLLNVSTDQLTGTATLDFPSTAAGTSQALTIAVPGAVVGNPVSVGLPAAPAANASFTAYVSAPDVVTVRHNNFSSGAIDPASGTFKVVVHKF